MILHHCTKKGTEMVMTQHRDVEEMSRYGIEEAWAIKARRSVMIYATAVYTVLAP